MDIQCSVVSALQDDPAALDKVRLVAMCLGVGLSANTPTMGACIARNADSEVVGFYTVFVNSVTGLWVDPSMRAQGVAKHMIAYARLHLDGSPFMSVSDTMMNVKDLYPVQGQRWNQVLYTSPDDIRQVPTLEATIVRLCTECNVHGFPELDKLDYMAAVSVGKLVGFSLWDANGVAGLWVDPSIRSQGIGKKLLSYADNNLTTQEALDFIYTMFNARPIEDNITAKMFALIQEMKVRGGVRFHDNECDMTLYLDTITSGDDGYCINLSHYPPEMGGD